MPFETGSTQNQAHTIISLINNNNNNNTTPSWCFRTTI